MFGFEVEHSSVSGYIHAIALAPHLELQVDVN